MYRKPYIEDRAFKVRRPLSRGQRAWRDASSTAMAQVVPPRVLPILQRTGGTYLGEDETYYYWMEPGATDQLGGFFDNVGNMFKRMVKFTPKSFTPGNIYKGFVNTSLTTMTGGLYQVLPKDIKKTVYEVGKVAIPVVAGGVLAMTAGPAVMATLMPKLTAAAGILSKGAGAIGSVFGGGKSAAGGEYYGPPAPGAPSGSGFDFSTAAGKALTIGGEVINLLNKLPQNKQAEVVQQLTPEDIAYMEQYRQVPPRLKDYFDSMAQQTFNPPMGSSGAASLYPGAPPAEEGPAEASMFGDMNMSTILLFAVPFGFYLLTQRSGRR
jgi:hypothetical protein